MNSIKYLLIIIILTALVFSCKDRTQTEVVTIEVESDKENIAELDPNATYMKAEFTIDGMTCEIGCARTIQKKLTKMEGVKSATVDFDRKLAMVEYNEAKVTPTSLEETVTKVADIYKVSDMKTVDAFSTISKQTNKVCNKDCCKGKTDEEKANCKKACCSGTASANKKACAADCKKACCAEKA